MNDQNRRPIPGNPIHKYYQQEPDLRFAVLSAEQEKDLFLRARKGDEEARTFLIENHLLFTAQAARQRSKGKLPDDEVVSAANSALMNCIDRFDPNRGARFTTYLRFYIRAAISKLWTERDPVDYKKHFPVDEPEDPAFRAPLEEQVETPDYAGQELKTLMFEALLKIRSTLSESDQRLLRRHYDDGATFADIGREENPPVSREAIRTRHKRLLGKLRSVIKGETTLE
jgi:RNA polymerase sigma factor (sigma-70 family)